MEKFVALFLILLVTVLFVIYAPRIIVSLLRGGGSILQGPSNNSSSSNEEMPPSAAQSPEPSPEYTSPAPEPYVPPPPDYLEPTPTTPALAQIRLYGVNNYDPAAQSFTLYNTGDAPVNITGFKVKSVLTEVIIPKGVERLPASYYDTPRDIILKPYETAYVSISQGPIGVNFKENLCTGYIQNITPDLSPSLSLECPRPDRSEYVRFIPACISYIDSLPTCPALNDPPYAVTSNAECTQYLNNTFNYGACFQKYSNQADFTRSSWRIFLNSSPIFREQYENVTLYDRQGNKLDEYRNY